MHFDFSLSLAWMAVDTQGVLRRDNKYNKTRKINSASVSEVSLLIAIAPFSPQAYSISVA